MLAIGPDQLERGKVVTLVVASRGAEVSLVVAVRSRTKGAVIPVVNGVGRLARRED